MSTLRSDDSGVVQPCPSCGQKNRIPYERIGEEGKCGRCGAAIPIPSAPVDIASEAVFRRLVERSPLPVVVDFWAPWCGPCRMVAPEMEKVAAAMKGRLLVVKVDTQALPDLGARLNVMSIPTLAVYAQGRKVTRTAGARPAPAIQAFIEQALPGVFGARA